MGTSPPGESYNRDGVGVPLLNGPTEFGPFHPRSTLFTTESKRECLPGDLIFCVRGNTTGRMNWADRVYSLGRGVCAIRGNTEADSTFLRYCLEWSLKRLLQRAGGSTMPNLTQETIRSFSVPYPASRHRIALILSAYDDLIENNTRRIAILEEMARALYREWFVHFRFPGHEKVKLAESPLGPIPEGWKVLTLRDLCAAVDYGYTASAQAEPVGPKFLRITDIVPALIDWRSVPYCEIPERKISGYLLREGDIVIARTGATTGYAKRLHRRHPQSIFASYLVRVRPSDARLSLYMGIVLESDGYKRFIQSNFGGAAQPNANAQVLTSLKVAQPPDAVLDAFNGVAEPLFDQREVLQQTNTNLRATRDLLLPKLISGEIDVLNKAEAPLEATA